MVKGFDATRPATRGDQCHPRRIVGTSGLHLALDVQRQLFLKNRLSAARWVCDRTAAETKRATSPQTRNGGGSGARRYEYQGRVELDHRLAGRAFTEGGIPVRGYDTYCKRVFSAELPLELQIVV
jgi:hypothetical protein